MTPVADKFDPKAILAEELEELDDVDNRLQEAVRDRNLLEIGLNSEFWKFLVNQLMHLEGSAVEAVLKRSNTVDEAVMKEFSKGEANAYHLIRGLPQQLLEEAKMLQANLSRNDNDTESESDEGETGDYDD